MNFCPTMNFSFLHNKKNVYLIYIDLQLLIMDKDQYLFCWQLSNNKLKLKDSKTRGNGRKLDGVGPVDNRPSINKLHHFV